VSLTILVLLVIPAIYVIWRGRSLRHQMNDVKE
jgi:hypothetical protein